MKILLIPAILCWPVLAQQTAAPATSHDTPAASGAPAAASPVPSEESWLTGYIDLGYRWETGVYGSLNTYRSIVDLGSGPKLLGTEFAINDPKHRFFDRINVRAFNWGDDPNETLRIDVKKTALYDFSADYRNIAYYSNLPGFADPLLGTTGVVLNEQSLDTRQHIGSFRLELRPGSRIVPYLDYDRDADTGRGVATFVSGGDEYPVVSLTRDSTHNYRGGVRLELSRFHLTLEQGGTTFKDDQQLDQSTGQINFGNFTAPLFGQTLDLQGLGEAYGVRGTSIYSKGLLAANITPWLELYGQFLYSQPDSRVNFQETSAGNQVALSRVLFYTGEQSIVSAESKMPHTSGSFGAEIQPFRRLRIIPSWLTDRLHTNGSSAFGQSLTTAGGLLPVNTPLSSALSTNYNQAGANLIFDLTRKLTLRGGYRYVWGNAADVILPLSGLAGVAQGKIRNNVFLTGLTWRPFQKLSVNADFEDGASGSTYFRTSLYNYQKGRVRGRYQLTNSFSLTANATVLNNQNPTPGIHYDFLSHQESASLFFAPSGGKTWDFEGSYTRATLRSDVNYLDPEFLISETSLYRENSHAITALIDLTMPGWLGYKTKLTVGGSAFLSSGSNPTTFYQPVAKMAVALTKHLTWMSEWRYYGFGESFYLYQSFRTQMVTTGVRFSR